jgi:hypothetical protein
MGTWNLTSIVYLPSRSVKCGWCHQRHITSGTRKLWTNRDNASVEYVLTGTWKTSFSFTTTLSLTPACAHVRQSRKCDGLFSPSCSQPRSSALRLPPVWPCKGCTKWAPFCRWQGTETKFSWCALKPRQGIIQHWYAATKSVGWSVLKTTETLWENSFIIANDVWTIHVNCNMQV